jgi:hypothetical protein
VLEIDGWFRFLPCYLVMIWMCWSHFSGTWLLVSEIFWLALFLRYVLSVPWHLLCSGWVGLSARPVVFIHYLHSNPHSSQMGRVWVENNYPFKKWVGWVWGGYK